MTTYPLAGSARPAARRLALACPELPALLGLAAILNLWALDRNGFANEYYSAAVRAMSTSWHAFLYGSFDSTGAMTVDKPPLALWVQALSVRAFGFHPLSMLVPQALMGVGSVALVYDLVCRRFGRAGGTVAGLALALTPITVAISRHNNPDALLVLCSVAALWLTVRALEDGRTRWLLLAGAAVGLGFEAKMAAALLVLPGIAAAYLWVAPRGRGRAVAQLLGGGAVLVAVGGAWPLLMALTPAAARPWISGTADNSIWSLIFGYNGLGRLGGQAGGPAGGGGPGGGVFGGDPGLLRLLDASLGGQAGWLLGFAIAGGVAILAATRLRRSEPRTGWLIAVGGAFVVTAVAFSGAQGIFHPYYVSLLAPFAAALVGAGAAQLLELHGTARLLAPAAVVAGMAAQLYVLRALPGQLETVAVAMAVASVLAAAVLAVAETMPARRVALGVALAALLVAPATWSVQTLGHATNGTFPAGGPATTGFAGGAPGGFAGRAAGGMFGDGGSLASAIAYAEANGGGAIAVSSQSAAASAVLDSGADVAGIGGFSGRESEVTADWLAQRVADGSIRWVEVGASAGGMPNDSRAGSTVAMAAVSATCTAVTSVDGLYDCAQPG
jgi:4-amino-4-deoxy-L-arabinose transferase-like glycosyltransferase